MAPALTGKQKRFLRALAHDKKPVVQLGKEGLTDAVTKAVDQSLETHELIKVKVASSGDESLDDLGERLAKETRSSLCDVVGRTLLLYRRRTKKPTINLPKATTKADPEGTP
jgi:RNA-binding protein